MWRLLFAAGCLTGLFVLVPWIAESSHTKRESVAHALSEPDLTFDVDRLAIESENRALQTAMPEEIQSFRGMKLWQYVEKIDSGRERERRIAIALLGASGSIDAIEPLKSALTAEQDPRSIATLVTALAESRRKDAILHLIEEIEARNGSSSFEACRALENVFRVDLGLDADAWRKWLESTSAIRD